MSEDSRIILGRINGLYGVRGWVKVFSYTEPFTNIFSYPVWQLYQHQQWRPVNLIEGQQTSKTLIAHLAGYDDPNQSARLLGADIAVYRYELPPVDEGEYYWMDLIGLTVINQQQHILGQVTSLLETGTHDVLVLSGERERLIPFVLEKFVLAVDLEKKIIYVDWHRDF